MPGEIPIHTRPGDVALGDAKEPRRTEGRRATEGSAAREKTSEGIWVEREEERESERERTEGRGEGWIERVVR